MINPVFNLLDDRPGHMRGRIAVLYGLLIGANVAAWGWALAAFHAYPVLLGTAFLAYGFGLRHAVDADHIAAIDNVTRKLMQEGKRPIAAGCFFSLGHSTVVVPTEALERPLPKPHPGGHSHHASPREQARGARTETRS